MRGMKTFAAILLLGLLLWAPWAVASSGMPGMPGGLKAATTEKKADKAPTAQELLAAAPEKMQSILAGLSDEQVRRLLLETLAETVASQPDAPEKPLFVSWLDSLREHVHFMHQRVLYVLSGSARASDLLPQDLREMLEEKGPIPVPSIFLGLAALFAFWWLVKRLLLYKTRKLRAELGALPLDTGVLSRIPHLFFKAGVELLTLALAALVTVLLYLTLFSDFSSTRTVLFLFLAVVVFFECMLWLARLLLAPDAPALRLPPLSDDAARQLYRVCLLLAFEAGIGMTLCGVLQLTSASESVYLLALMGTGLVLVLTISLLALWTSRDVADALRETFPPGTLRHQLAGSWHVVTIGYVLFFWLFWVLHILASGRLSMLSGIFTLLAFPCYLLLTWAMDKLVVQTGALARGALLEPGREAEEPAADCPVSRFRRFLSKALGVVLFASFLTVLAAIWDLEVPVAERVVQGAFSILMTLILAYAFWAFSKAAIERRLRSQFAGGGGHDEHGGGMGDRLSTLLELLKRFIFVTLLIMVTLIVLSAIGVDTSPLLAGAGVVGIALGFGSQTLVKDIVSGVFFLMDDAFRIGDYIDLGNARGTVEGISVRSLKLRHHRGSIYTVPYGSIHMVNNLTRDWAIMKLEYLVPHGTDVQVIKKIVKRINKELKEIPELAAVMLGDVKCQGVKEIEDYGLRMRIKMTTKPGGQYTLRKWIWGKLRRYFDEAGIHFANRKVSVVISEDSKEEHDRMQQLGAAAAQALEDSLLEEGREGKG